MIHSDCRLPDDFLLLRDLILKASVLRAEALNQLVLVTGEGQTRKVKLITNWLDVCLVIAYDDDIALSS